MRTDLNRLEQLWGMALLNAAFGVWDLNLLQQTVNYSPEWKLLLGYESVDAPDSTATWRSRVHPEDLAPMLAALSAHLKGSSPGYECEFRLRAADGSYRWVLSRGRVVERDAQGQALRAVGTLTDLTDRRQADVLRAERDRAEAANRAKSEFMSRMSHELRTPLNAVLGFAQLLSSRIGETKPDLDMQRRHVAHIERAGWQLLSMVDKVLELSRLESLQVPLQIQTVALAPILQAAAVAMQPQAQQRALQLHLMPTPPSAAVRADPERLGQVLSHLLGNAIQFNREGGSVTVAVAVSRAVAAAPAVWALSVTDTGMGIPQAQLDQLFDPFDPFNPAMQDTTDSFGKPGTGTADGLGVGLALVRWLVDTMGGRIDVRSSLGVGSIFTVTLPAAEALSALPQHDAA